MFLAWIKSHQWIYLLQRGILWTAFLSLVGLLVFYAKPPKKAPLNDPETSFVMNPSLQGLNAKGHRYLIQSSQAQFGKDFIDFFAPKMILDTGKTLHLSSHKGVFHLKSQSLDLVDRVLLEGPQYVLQTAKARLHMPTKHVESDQPTMGKAVFGSFRSDGFSHKDHVLVLKGPVSVQLKGKNEQEKTTKTHLTKDMCLKASCSLLPLCL